GRGGRAPALRPSRGGGTRGLDATTPPIGRGAVRGRGDRSMDANSGSAGNERLALRFARLWEGGPAAPDVFAFLSSPPSVRPPDRLHGLLVDQRQRWRRGQPLPLRVYLSAFPEIAERGELIRVLVDGERQERRFADRRHDTVGPRASAERLSEAPTEPV